MTYRMSVLVEACVDSVLSAVAAERGGAARLELCASLADGGTTPSAGTIEIARKYLSIGLQVMIRPRGGDFCYSDVEFEIMQRDIAMAKQLRADGVVFGLLLPEGAVDVERTRALVELARPLNVTFHRAFDMTNDPFQALEDLIGIGVDRILTSGQEPSVLEGLDLITELVHRASDQVIIMPGGASERNIKKIVAQSGVREVHVASTQPVDSQMRYSNPRVFMGGELRPPEYTRFITDPARIDDLRRQVSE